MLQNPLLPGSAVGLRLGRAWSLSVRGRCRDSRDHRGTPSNRSPASPGICPATCRAPLALPRTVSRCDLLPWLMHVTSCFVCIHRAIWCHSAIEITGGRAGDWAVAARSKNDEVYQVLSGRLDRLWLLLIHKRINATKLFIPVQRMIGLLPMGPYKTARIIGRATLH